MNVVYENEKDYENKTVFATSKTTDRLEGDLCGCNGNGEFVLLPEDDKICIEGGKRYMICQKCNQYSHL
jgi:hypothetical protein